MKALPLLIALLLAPLASTRAKESSLEGCLTAGQLTNSIKAVVASNWELLGPADLAKLWPTTLKEKGCESEKGCLIFGGDSRIIAGRCQCCESFDFEKRKDGNDYYLKGFVVKYSVSDRLEALKTANRLITAAGFKQGKARIKDEQDFSKTASAYQAALTINVNPDHGRWQIYIAMHRYPLNR